MIVDVLNKILLFFLLPRVNFVKTKLSFFLARIDSNNFFECNYSKLKKAKVFIRGESNQLRINRSFISSSTISIKGNDNIVVIEEGVVLQNVNINIRGTNCIVKIGSFSSFGGARIINVGVSNEICIGSRCMFSDKVELWASDTHSIYDLDGNWINQEKPIHIGDNVWIGSGVTILKGVKIGDWSVIGMNSLVTKNVDNNCIAAGSPAKIIKVGVTWKLDYKID